MYLTATFVSVFIIYSVPSVGGQDVSVNTGVGTIVGEVKQTSFDNTPVTVIKFLGIPYAEPPTGEGRFERPLKKQPFTEIFRATKMSAQCMQKSAMEPNATKDTSEDCLYLNILVPGSSINTTNKKAVMVWIYGGGFQEGRQDEFTSPVLAGYNDVILVTLNYRVSLFGFLSTGNDHLPGNYGLSVTSPINWSVARCLINVYLTACAFFRS